jgi:hypothetical protein
MLLRMNCANCFYIKGVYKNSITYITVIKLEASGPIQVRDYL